MNRENVNRVILLSSVLVALGALLPSCSTQAAGSGPYGGDVVPLEGGTVQAEMVANADSGEVMVHTWGADLQTPRPIAAQPLVVGSEDRTVTLEPHPLATDPPDSCSRFYGKADWVRGGGVKHGWMRIGAGDRAAFEWRSCWQAGRAHGPMWSEMGRHHGQGAAAGMEHGGGRGHK